MKATNEFSQYRLQVFNGLMTLEQFRDLQSGKDVKVNEKLVKQYPALFTGKKAKTKEIKNGS